MRLRPALLAAALGASFLVPLTSTASTPSPTCSWGAKSEPDTVNAAYPDTNASYWSHPYVNAPGTELVIRGTYPKARYLSFHVYQPSGVPLDSVYDAKITPDKGSSNPFAGGSSKAARQQYTVHVVFTTRPAKPAPNTLYAGTSALGGTRNAGGLLMMRVYTPTDSTSPQGGVPLPTVSVVAAGATVEAGEACSSDLPNTHGAGTSALNDASYPHSVNATTQQIVWGKAFGNAAFGFFGNQQNAYLTAGIDRVYGDMVVIRTKAPRFPDTVRGTYPSSRDQLRYWSICQNSASTRVNACTADYQTTVDRRGYLTIVISDPSQRPANATTANGVTWLPWGVTDEKALLIYRHMVPSSFPQSIQSITKTDNPQKVMGAYFPSARYCSKRAFEHAGWNGCLES